MFCQETSENEWEFFCMFLYCFQLSCARLNIVEKLCFVVLISWSCDLWNFSTQKKNFPVKRFFTGIIFFYWVISYFIHDICILLFRYPPISHFIPWTWSRQPAGELSKHLFPNNLQCMHCFMWIRWLKNQQPGLSLCLHCHFFLHPLTHKTKKSWSQVTSHQHLLRTLCKHILYIVILWVTAVFEK